MQIVDSLHRYIIEALKRYIGRGSGVSEQRTIESMHVAAATGSKKKLSIRRSAIPGRYCGKFFCCDFPETVSGFNSSGVNQSSAADCASYKYMKADLVKAASEVIPNQQILVNMVSRRVRQLCLGHRPLVEYAPGLGHADVALTEIANQKLTFESTLGQNGKNEAAHVVQFPGIIVSKKIAAKEKAA